MVVEGAPYGVVVVDRDRVVNPHVPHGAADITGVVLEAELGRVHADHDQPAADVFPGPGADIGQLAEPVDAGVGPEVDQDHLPAQAVRRQRGRIEPPGRAAEGRQLTLEGQPDRGRVQSSGRAPVRFHRGVRNTATTRRRSPACACDGTSARKGRISVSLDIASIPFLQFRIGSRSPAGPAGRARDNPGHYPGVRPAGSRGPPRGQPRATPRKRRKCPPKAEGPAQAGREAAAPGGAAGPG